MIIAFFGFINISFFISFYFCYKKRRINLNREKGKKLLYQLTQKEDTLESIKSEKELGELNLFNKIKDKAKSIAIKLDIIKT